MSPYLLIYRTFSNKFSEDCLCREQFVVLLVVLAMEHKLVAQTLLINKWIVEKLHRSPYITHKDCIELMTPKDGVHNASDSLRFPYLSHLGSMWVAHLDPICQSCYTHLDPRSSVLGMCHFRCIKY